MATIPAGSRTASSRNVVGGMPDRPNVPSASSQLLYLRCLCSIAGEGFVTNIACSRLKDLQHDWARVGSIAKEPQT